jgi:hypothetical protein
VSEIAGARGAAAAAGRSRLDAGLLFLTSLLAGVFLGARDPGRVVRGWVLARFELEAVAARGLSWLSPSDVARAAGLAPGQRLAEVDPASVEARLRAHPWIRDAQVQALPPGRLLVDVVERRPAALAAQGGSLWVVDEAGEAFAEGPAGLAEELPLLHVPAGAAPETCAALRREGLRVAARLAAHGLPPAAEIWLGPGERGDGVALRLRGSQARVVLGTAPLEPRLAALARLLVQAPEEARAAARIDLRFADRAVLSGRPADGGEGGGGARRRGAARAGSRRVIRAARGG